MKGELLFEITYFSNILFKSKIRIILRVFSVALSGSCWLSCSCGFSSYSNTLVDTSRLLESDEVCSAAFKRDGSSHKLVYTFVKNYRALNSTHLKIRLLYFCISISFKFYDRCVYNCHVGRERLFYYDKIELDLKLPDYVDTSAFRYYWYIWRYHNASFLETATEAVVETGTSLHILLFAFSWLLMCF